MIRNKERGFALVLALVLLLAMSLMGGALVVTASSDHRGNNSSDEYQQAFYVAETALLEAQKSLMDRMIGPINVASGMRSYENRGMPINQSDPVEGTREDLNLTPCVKSFKNIDSREGSTFRVVEYVRDQNFYDIIQPIIEGDRININLGTPEEIAQEIEKLSTFRYEYLSVLVGMETFTGTGTSVKKTQFKAQKRGAAYRIYGCGIMGSVDRPDILIPLETLVILSY